MVPPAFKSRPFRHYWLGHLLSITGSQMQLGALYWHLRTLTDKPIMVSGIGLARFLPVIFLSLVAGAVADRTDRRKMAIYTQLILAVMSLLLGFATFRGGMTLGLLFLIVTLHSAAAAFDVPFRQALIPALVPRRDLTNAYSLNSIASKIGGVLGPALAGMIISLGGLEWAYWINALSYLAVITALITMGKVQEKPVGKTAGTFTPWKDIKEGIVFLFQSPILFSIMILDFFGAFFSSAKTLLPFVAIDILRVGPLGYGWLFSAQSLGTVLTGLYISQKNHLHRQGFLMIASVMLFGTATIIFGFSRLFWLTMGALLFIGIFDGLSSIIRNTARQVLTPDSMRGRVISVSQIFLKGGPQLGEVESGLAAQIMGVPFAIVSGGLGCIIAAWIIVKKNPRLWSFNGDEENMQL